ncbi:unnamed protein product [Trichobilharzia regenti]|uniref:BHLH domain-containing protein n=1 Tax=Trichobilharzia regenti TaxID=157069 RepID=A0A183VLW5_TRIRE|nr:unnamed protein product [Trichobilharzia regenti]VDP97350.1 unnamed protein product [Trichobilharzia regenti]
MIPFTDTRGDCTRVPPIYSPPHITTMSNQPTGSNISLTVPQSKVPSRRGRRSNVPPEIREQTRRLKKQNMERRRRACISDKMNALHNLAMNLIGIDPEKCGKVEKADILNLCHAVFQGIANISKDEPELRSRLQKLRHTLNQTGCSSSSSSSASTSSTVIKNESTLNTDRMTETTVQQNKQSESLHSNCVHFSNLPIQSSQTSLFTSSYNDFQHKMNDDNKENIIPKMIVKNPLSNRNTTPVNSVNNLPPASIQPMSSPLPFSISTPVSKVHSNTAVHSHIYESLGPSQSTPLHYSGKWNLSLNNSDSGFFSSQSTELTSSVQKTPISETTDNKLHPYQFVDSPSLKVSNVASSSSSNPALSSLRNTSLSTLSSQSREHLSAFSVPVKRLPLVTMVEQSNVSSKSSSDEYKRQYSTTSSDNRSSRHSDTSQFNTIASYDNKNSNTIKPVWRPYLD